VCQKRNKSAKGFDWRFAHPEEQEQGEVEDAVSAEELKCRIRGYSARPVLAEDPVVVLDRDSDEVLRHYESVSVVAVCLDVPQMLHGLMSEKAEVCEGLWLALRITGGALAGGSGGCGVGGGDKSQAIAAYTCKLRSGLLVRFVEDNSFSV
jgi:hypothetical protein